MKALDIWARRHSIPTYTAGRKPADWLLALYLLTELRYESFTPNHIRVPKNQENFSEPMQLVIHVGIFAFLQALPQNIPTVLAFEVMLAIYIIWTSLQMLLRYKSSPALFGMPFLLVRPRCLARPGIHSISRVVAQCTLSFRNIDSKLVQAHCI